MNGCSEIGQSQADTSKIVDVLRLEDVSCVRRGRRILDRVSMSVRPGDVVVVEGPRGTGKSTLLGLAAAIARPGAGAVFIGGRRVQGLQKASLPFVRRNIGYLPPDPLLLREESAIENVMLAMAVRGHDVLEAQSAAADILNGLGLEHAMHDKVMSLSMGEARLVALARALVGSPAVVVLDEPTAGLTREDSVLVAERIADAAAKGSAVLCASADGTLMAVMAQMGAEKLSLRDGRLLGGATRMRLIGLDGVDRPSGKETDEGQGGDREMDGRPAHATEPGMALREVDQDAEFEELDEDEWESLTS